MLRETAVFQESGIVMELPDWWRSGKGPRPTVSVTIDAPKKTSLHAGALLGFKIEHSLEGEPLTAAETAQIAAYLEVAAGTSNAGFSDGLVVLGLAGLVALAAWVALIRSGRDYDEETA